MINDKELQDLDNQIEVLSRRRSEIISAKDKAYTQSLEQKYQEVVHGRLFLIKTAPYVGIGYKVLKAIGCKEFGMYGSCNVLIIMDVTIDPNTRKATHLNYATPSKYRIDSLTPEDYVTPEKVLELKKEWLQQISETIDSTLA